MQQLNLKNLSLQEMEDLVSSLGEKPYRVHQIYEWVFQKDVSSIGEMTNLSKNLRNQLSELSYISRLSIADKRVSKDGTEKYLLMLEDGNSIESVLIPDEDRLTLCISTQVGCKLNCAFCLTGKGGFIRNLNHYEIIEQILSVRREKKDIINIVLMGMGEPLDNYENVIKSIKTMISPHGLKIPAKRITLSTSGLIPEIKKLAKENLKINLAVSLNASDNETRDKIMPLSKKYPIEELLKTLKEYPLPPNRRITFEYVMIKRLNDSIEDAKKLSNILKGIKCKINLIPFNSYEGVDYEAPDYKNVEDFRNILISQHYTTIIRKSKGADISAACGQLRGKWQG
ncbi:MAG: 23S rRNA (adenine(2503)-C(2))-methyltransferase [Nitrospinae bacterium RIFCSPLOWO2_12_39_16]|nr:MAG: 23S rRNA (adenine(2503)-C(2))-methyltransferase [Nitrospinae bacterium RIFCSPLOWO2_12_39_16]